MVQGGARGGQASALDGIGCVMRSPEQIIDEVNPPLASASGAQIVAALRAEGWHLVSTPQVTEFRDPVRHVSERSVRGRVDDRGIETRDVLPDRLLIEAYSPTLLSHARAERMMHDFAVELVKALTVPEAITAGDPLALGVGMPPGPE